MNNIRSFIRIIGQLNYIMTEWQRKRVILVFFCMLIASALEMIGLSVIYPFLQLIMNENAMQEKWYTRWIYFILPEAPFTSILAFMCLFIVVVYLLKNVVTLWCNYIENRFASGFQRELSTRVLHYAMRQPYEYFVNQNCAKIHQSVLGDTAATYDVLKNLLEFTSSILTVTLIGCYLIYTDWLTALIAILLSMGCFVLIVLCFKKKLKQAGKDIVVASTKRGDICNQTVYGIKEISVMDRRVCFERKYDEASREVERITVLYSFLSACPDRIIEAVGIGGLVGLSAIKIMMGTDPGEFVPVLGAFIVGAFKILPSISKMSSRINNIVYNRSRLDRCYTNLKETRQYGLEWGNKELGYNESNKDRILDFRDAIEIRDVSWKYQNSNTFVLRELNLTIQKGDAIALIGASGAGKTTLADIVLGLFQPQEGKILLDGIDINNIPHSWSKMVGYVPQSVFLIDDSIRANIAFGLEKDEIDEDKIWKALEQAQLADFIKGLPEQLNTDVGERGIKFSGGQRQRVAIARALYDNPQILILDEATSALDTETETAVMESIDLLRRQKTIIIIAHRLSTIRNCDRVYEIVGGKAIERDKSSILEKDIHPQ